MTHLHLRLGSRHLPVTVQRDGAAYRVTVESTEKVVEARYVDDGTLLLTVDGRRYRVALAREGRSRFVGISGETYHFVAESPAAGAQAVGTAAPPEITAPMPGKVLQVLVAPGDRVAAGAGLVILEAMKMETRLVAEAPATVSAVHVAAGQTVDGGQVLVELAYRRDEGAPDG